VRVFKDEGRSGYSGEYRPGFEDMLKFLSKGEVQVLIARHHDRLTRNAEDIDRLMRICGSPRSRSVSTQAANSTFDASGGFYGFIETGKSSYESAIRSQRVKDAVERNARAGKTWQGSMIRRVLMSPRIAGLKEHRGEIVGEATWPAIIRWTLHMISWLGSTRV
jgi:DNA invertase Pin-like site-specific DNA recombinase